MDHEEAIRTAAVERYQLDEMTEEDREAFEEHYFACPTCAEAVRTAVALRREMKTALQYAELREIRPWWVRLSALLPAAAALAMAGLLVYQNAVTLPRLRAPRLLAPAVVLDGVTRGAAVRVPGGALHFVMGLEDITCPYVRVDVQTDGGRTVAGGVVPAPAPGQPLDIYFPGNFAPGSYRLVVREEPEGKEITRSSFQVAEESGTR